MEYDIFFDESGDLGWVLDKPFRKDGSSKFFSISYIIIPAGSQKHLSRFVRGIYKERNRTTKELKGTDFRAPAAKSVSRRIAAVIERHNFIAGSIVVNKSNVPIRLMDPGCKDVLYNFMVQLGLCDKVSSFDTINIIPDERSVPSVSKNTCSDLIRSKLWLEMGSNTIVNYTPKVSHQSNELMFIDWITNFTWRNYENNEPAPFQILERYMDVKELFF